MQLTDAQYVAVNVGGDIIDGALGHTAVLAGESFRSRKLYEIPSGQGFCLPYGFIAGDSGHEQRNMGVTWGSKNILM